MSKKKPMDKQTSRMLFSVYSWERRAQRREASLVKKSYQTWGEKKKNCCRFTVVLKISAVKSA